ncbi:Asp-tRNA(Asn)/Glu-tRNA(Gln) amidotransferase subunit GatA [Oleidesulfovibrio sp.]|uniref:Asp-tRNA(Asn)/Glu-tRNA(Gln) amidotransferase subunit GatA n=1 Tax=Oleidesulfovibrio sp. TaxID=2909707 RepID=UPI003A8A46FB
MAEIYAQTLTEVATVIAEGKLTAEEATRSCIERMQSTEPAIQAMLATRFDDAIAEAKAMDNAGYDSSKPLWGVPVTVKDVLSTKGVTTTCGSKILENYTPFFDAYVVQKLKEAGSIILGKNNMDEFAMGSSTEKSAYHPTFNPWDTQRVPGGSSGGSAASVAAGQCFASLGTDTGGSIRQPASFCGCVGLKPTYGRVSRYGMVAYGSSLDQIGPLTRSVEDAARVLSVIAGHDKRDSTCSDHPVDDYLAALASRGDLSGLRIGLPVEYWGEGLDAEVESPCREAIKKAQELGATIVDISLPNSKHAIAVYYIVAMAEASSNLARFDGVRSGHRSKKTDTLLDLYVQSRTEGFGEEVKRRIMLGTYVLSSGYYDAYYRKAAQVRRLIREDFEKAFEKCDIICGPASPITAWKQGEMSGDPLKMYLLDIFTISLNLAGLPGLSLPVGTGSDSGMPVGLQLLGKAFDESTLLSSAHVLENHLGRPAMPAL